MLPLLERFEAWLPSSLGYAYDDRKEAWAGAAGPRPGDSEERAFRLSLFESWEYREEDREDGLPLMVALYGGNSLSDKQMDKRMEGGTL
jgi:hypothetical protein